ncbi:unnamed protein product [Caenorhabditis angaria]|uniref:Uncharacterized protein n=1 Tax=Caenorhabditis angaria TaxID=860376 RepID=A0A9P1I825_9PELO|nr:unnamed protein product [Caenorhabditis angaria]
MQFVSATSLNLRRRIEEVRLFINERYGDYDLSTWIGLSNSMLLYVSEFDALLRQDQVRIHRDRTHLTPEVYQGVSKNAIISRLNRQVRSAATLADLIFTGVDGNPAELALLSRMELAIEELYQIVYAVDVALREKKRQLTNKMSQLSLSDSAI